jgi:molecular chaperone GrpE
MENFRKRTDRELDNARKYAIERFAQELVTVGDALEAGIQAGAANPGPALLEGAQATLKQLHRAFDKAGIKIIDPAGQPFDPAWHEAMVAQESRTSRQYGIVGDSKGLFLERPLAAPGPGHRQQGAGGGAN